MAVLGLVLYLFWHFKPDPRSFHAFWRHRQSFATRIFVAEHTRAWRFTFWNLLALWLVGCEAPRDEITAIKSLIGADTPSSQTKWFVGVLGVWYRLPKSLDETLQTLLLKTLYFMDIDLMGKARFVLERVGEFLHALGFRFLAAFLYERAAQMAPSGVFAAHLLEKAAVADPNVVPWSAAARAYKACGSLLACVRCLICGGDLVRAQDMLLQYPVSDSPRLYCNSELLGGKSWLGSVQVGLPDLKSI